MIPTARFQTVIVSIFGAILMSSVMIGAAIA